MPVDRYCERVIARLDAIRPWAPVAREEAERSVSALAAEADAPAAEADAPAADPPPPARDEHEDPRIMAVRARALAPDPVAPHRRADLSRA